MTESTKIEKIWVCDDCNTAYFKLKPHQCGRCDEPKFIEAISLSDLKKVIEGRIAMMDGVENLRKINKPNDKFLHGHIVGTKESLENLLKDIELI